MTEWTELETSISEVNELINNGYTVELDSPDGWVEATEYVHKGIHAEYKLVTKSGKVVYSSWDHLYETPNGWEMAKDLVGYCQVLTENGFEEATVALTGRSCEIVDVVIDHPNHRYYTNGVSSHNTNVGKSLIMCHLSSAYMKAGKNVLYITMEMAEERISERIDANLLNVDLDDMMMVDKTTFLKKINHIKQRTVGRLKVVEYPTAAAGAANFRHLLNELKIKNNFIPDVILIDYINICASSRIKASSNANSFTIIKAIAEELRGLAVEFNVPIWSATQTTRSGLSNSDLELGDVSESIALASTCDFMLAISQSDELAELGQYMFKQLKSRYGDKNKIKRFVVGVDKGKMRLFDIDQDEAGVEDKPLMDKTSFGQEDFERRKPKSKFNKAKFGEFK